MNLSDPVMAALIGASATFTTALFQLLINARRQAAERAAGKPASRKSGTWLAIFALMLAAAVGGYAFSEYQGFRDRDDEKRLRQEMQTSLRDIGNVAVRLERAGLQRSDQGDVDAMLAAERRRGIEGVAAVIEVPACAGSQSGTDASAMCNEAHAVHVTVCAVIPLTAVVSEVQVFTRAADAAQPWTDAKVQPGQDAGSAKFIDTFSERAQGDAKEVCQQFMHWNSQKPRLARILVKYTI
jgi:carbohydrate-selective porin OprB